MKKLLLFWVCLGVATFSFAQNPFWQSLNPGAGGRVQALSADDSDPGRLFFASDVEGFYVSDDYGENWVYGDKNRELPSSFIQKAIGRGNTIYVGHGLGLSYSTNGGSNYQLVPQTKNLIISAIEIDPNDANNVYAGFGNQDNNGTTRLYPWADFKTWNGGGEAYVKANTPRAVYYTTNGGSSWQVSNWASTPGDGRVYSIEVDPTNSNDVLMANADGLYRSANKASSWSKINGPSGVDLETCWGADFTPDGNFIYAIFRKNNFSRVFVKAYPNGAWQDVGKGPWSDFNNGNTAQPVYMWRPQVYQGSSVGEHFVMFSQLTQNPANKLIEARFTVSGDTVSQGEYNIVFGYDDGRDIANGGVSYDIGWNPYRSGVRHTAYFPNNWPSNADNPFVRGVFAMSQQSFFKGDAANGNTDWKVINTGYTKNIGGQNFHRDRGAASTFTYDVAAYQNYMIQGQADNGVVESWDGGMSWRQTIMFQDPAGLTDAHGVEVIERPNGGRVVLVSASKGFGGGNRAEGAYFLYKDLDLGGPDGTNDGFEVIKTAATSSASAVGLPNSRIWQFHQDPNNLNRLYVGTEKGIYVCDDFFDLIAGGNTTFRDINGSNGAADTRSFVEGFTFQANNSNILYYQCGTGVWRGVRSGTDYSWTQMTRGGDIGNGSQTNLLQRGGVASVSKGGTTYTYTVTRDDGLVRTNGNANVFEKVALSQADAVAVTGQPAWWADFTATDERQVQIGDFVAVGDRLYVPLQKWEQFKVGYGVVRGTVQNNGDVVWEDWSADVEYPVVRQVKYYENTNGTPKILMATRGNGVAARKTNGQRGDTKPAIRDDIQLVLPPSEFPIFTDNFPARNLLWEGVDSATSDVQTSASNAQASEGNTSQFVLGLNKSRPGDRPALVVGFDPIKASGGTVLIDLQGIGSAMNLINIKLLDKFNGSVDLNALITAPANRFETFRVPISGGTLNPDEFNRIQIETFGNEATDRLYIDNILIEGEGITYSTTGSIQVESVAVNPNTLTLVEGETFTITDITVLPNNAPNRNTSVATNSSLNVSVNGKVLTANASGTATITVASQSNPNVFDTIEVVVQEPAGAVVNIPNGIYTIQNKATGKFIRSTNANANSNLRADRNSGNGDALKWSKTDAGDGYLFLGSVFAEGRRIRGRSGLNSNVRQFTATNSANRSQWIATDTGDGDGSVFLTNKATDYQMRPASNSGTNLISGAADNGNLNKWVFVLEDGNSNVAVSGVSLSPGSTSLDIGNSIDLVAAISPTNASNQNLSYSSSNTAVATVNAFGRVTAVSEGNATISVTTDEGGFTDTATVIVLEGNGLGNGDCNATSPAGKPDPPCQVRAEVLSSSSVRLLWKDNANNETRFDIQAFRAGDQYRGGGLPDAGVNDEAIVLSGLSGTTYTFRIKAVNSQGGSVWVETDPVNLGIASFTALLPEQRSSEIQLFPNPVKNSFSIVGPSNAAFYSIFDMAGRKVKSGRLNGDGKETKVNVVSLKTGIYALKVGGQRFKMVVQK